MIDVAFPSRSLTFLFTSAAEREEESERGGKSEREREEESGRKRGRESGRERESGLAGPFSSKYLQGCFFICEKRG